MADSNYQPMTREVRTLIRGLALAFGHARKPDEHPWVSDDWNADSLDLTMLKTELALVQELHPDAGLGYSCPGPRKVHVAGDNYFGQRGSGIHVLSFGAYGCTHVLAFGSLDDALEDAAAVLKEVAPGVFTEPEYPDVDGLDADEREAAEADLTYTESGWIPSWAWTVTSFKSVEDVLTWAEGE